MKSVLGWQIRATEILTVQRLVLAMYAIALAGLLFFPLEGPSFRFLGIQSDKWMHILLFGGLAVLLRWNLADFEQALFFSVSISFFVAGATEVMQGLVAYRSAELMDFIAGFAGATVGAVGVDRVLLSHRLKKGFGLLVVVLGIMNATFFLLADVIGVGSDPRFGVLQASGMVLGALIAAGGIKVYLAGQRGLSQRR